MRELYLIICGILLLYYGQAVGEAGGSKFVTWSATEIPPLVAVSASEATLLTTPPIFDMNKSLKGPTTNEEQIEETEAEIATPTKFLAKGKSFVPNKPFKNRYKITKVFTNCTRSFLEMRLELNLPFHGLLYAKEFPHECRARGASEPNITLRLPNSGCGVRVEPRPDGSMELSVRIMMQMEEKLRQSSDILRTVKCRLPLNALGMSLTLTEAGKSKSNTRHGRMQHQSQQHLSKSSQTKQQLGDNDTGETEQPSPPTQQHEPSKVNHQNAHHSSSTSSTTPTSSTPRVRIWLELGGPDGSGSVVVGQATTLTVRAVVPGNMGLKIVDCAALDGLGESTQQLLDDRGCPIDEQVMPALHTRSKPAEEGWSKHNEDDLVEKTYTSTFPAFKFPDRERLHVSCGVQLCKGRCPNVNCHTDEKLVLSPDKYLARIEVFNSLAVTAPQIEVDRLRYDRRHNMSAEEYPPYIRPLVNDGTLCLSVSKLAFSFCILGLIFLVAIVVAITSLIRSRRRSAIHSCGTLSNNSSRLHRAEVCTSMFSSSESAHSARFATKFLMPYYPNTLPYGRVY
ncbi:cypher isoform X2 [Haematobia irritans]|uniref:cypher isoform X2 n=1 Tax=Haematobia irritans TaxID=7368 RepID=UPI003F4F40C2